MQTPEFDKYDGNLPATWVLCSERTPTTVAIHSVVDSKGVFGLGLFFQGCWHCLTKAVNHNEIVKWGEFKDDNGDVFHMIQPKPEPAPVMSA